MWCKDVLRFQDVFVKYTLLYLFYYIRDYKKSCCYQVKNYPGKQTGDLEKREHLEIDSWASYWSACKLSGKKRLSVIKIADDIEFIKVLKMSLS